MRAAQWSLRLIPLALFGLFAVKAQTWGATVVVLACAVVCALFLVGSAVLREMQRVHREQALQRSAAELARREAGWWRG